MIPEKLYGREGEIATLLAAFDRVVMHGGSELVLVSGYSGIGKSSVVNELHKVIVLPRGIFISGKFDLRLRGIPHSTWGELTASIAHEVNQPLGAMVTSAASCARWLAADPPQGDKVQCQQVLLNLIVNAIEAMSEIEERHRELTIVSAADGPDTVRVEVRDTGPGLDPDRATQLFEPFYTTKAEGMGIGLSISRSIIEAHGGHLWAVANSPRGAAFLLSLPVEEPVR